MLAMIPWLVMTFSGAIGWKLGNFVGTFTGAVAAIVGASLGFYYGRKIRRAVTP